MLRHVVMFKLKNDSPSDAIRSLEGGLRELSETISEIKSYRYGADLGLREGNFDFCLVAEFADAEAFERYVVHPEHQSFIENCLAPVVSQRVSVQYDV